MNEYEQKIPAFAVAIVRRLEKAGFEAWLVGGCVRDLLLNKVPHDYDIASSARPDQVTALFERTVPTGARYGTVTVFQDGGRAEITTFRGESDYRDGRRPGRVRFGGSLAADLGRRDFTVNAMALHLDRGLRDPFHGRDDLHAGVIRTVGEPDRRFAEDALRILRAYRFAARLGFRMEPATLAAARAAMDRTARLSGERIRAELDAILLGPRPSAALQLREDGLFAALGLEKRPVSAKEGVLENCPLSRRARWAAFLALTGLPAGAVCDRLRFDNATRRDSAALLAELRREPPRIDTEIRRRLRHLPPELYAEYLDVRAALTGCSASAAKRRLAGIRRRGEAYSLPQLAVGGSDLRAAGIPPGPEYARILERLLDYVTEHPDQNRPDALLPLIPGLRAEKANSSKTPAEQ